MGLIRAVLLAAVLFSAAPTAAAASVPTPAPATVTVVGTVHTSSPSSPWWQDPILTLLLGAVGSYAVAARAGVLQRRHDRTLAAGEREVARTQARAAARLARYQGDLDQARQRATESSDQVRTLRVLTAVLAQGDPDPAVAALPINATVFDDPALRDQAERIAVLLGEYGVCAASERTATRVRLQTEIAALLPEAQTVATAQAADLAALRGDGYKQTVADIALIEGTTPG